MASQSSINGRMRNSGARAVAGVLAVLMACTCLTACSDDEDTESQKAPPAPAPLPTTAASPLPESRAEADVLVVYNRAQGYFESVQKNGRVGDENVTDTMTNKARGQWASSGLQYQQQGIRLDGTITRNPKVTAIDPHGAPPTATVVDCIDISAAKVVDSKTGMQKKTANGQALRYVQTTSLVQDTGRWLVSDIVPERGRTC
ncbi:hypothetical protein [Streptomyces sp. SID3343]|uniref:hypothetical protein n=1 Tax=Streptomyces sp. SID3343 TaxID=2690260 RepID=UPI001370E418|nr:hypothetical protein [Streptomyces sp. SID3343]MYV97630.1 hypothetical protein [Streptomyces sp. SID3343]